MSINEKGDSIPLGLGTAAIGRPQYINIKTEADPEFSLDRFGKKGVEVLDKAYREGVRYFDTAPGYGLAEQLLIDWVDKREDPSIEIATKWGYTYVANFDPNAKQHEIKEHTLAKLNEQWEQSKKLFPSLTTYQIHSATFETGVLENEEILNRLAELKNEHGLLIGISTTGSNQKEVLQKALEVEVENKLLFDVFQITYNIFDQSLGTISNQISKLKKRLVIKEAMANGRVFSNPKYPHYSQTYKILTSMAAKYQVGLDAIALRFCMDSIAPFKVLSGIAQEKHLLDNLKALSFKLTPDEINVLQELAINPEAYWTERKLLGWN